MSFIDYNIDRDKIVRDSTRYRKEAEEQKRISKMQEPKYDKKIYGIDDPDYVFNIMNKRNRDFPVEIKYFTNNFSEEEIKEIQHNLDDVEKVNYTYREIENKPKYVMCKDTYRISPEKEQQFRKALAPLANRKTKALIASGTCIVVGSLAIGLSALANSNFINDYKEVAFPVIIALGIYSGVKIKDFGFNNIVKALKRKKENLRENILEKMVEDKYQQEKNRELMKANGRRIH